MANWYKISTKGRVDRFGVVKTENFYFKSTCYWTSDSIHKALEPLAEADGISEFEVTKFQVTGPPASHSTVRDVDRLLGI